MMLVAAEFGRLGVGRVKLNELLMESTVAVERELRLVRPSMGTHSHERESEVGGRRCQLSRAWHCESLHRQQLGIPDLWIRESDVDHRSRSPCGWRDHIGTDAYARA